MILEIIETLWMRAGPLVGRALIAENHTEHKLNAHKHELQTVREDSQKFPKEGGTSNFWKGDLQFRQTN